MAARFIPVLLALFAVALAGHSAAATIDEDLKKLIATSKEDEKLDVIVRLSEVKNPGGLKRSMGRSASRRELLGDLRRHSRETSSGVRQKLAARGVRIDRDLWHINAFSTSATAGDIIELSEMPEVLRISRDKVVTMGYEPSTLQATENPGWNIEALGAPALWALGHEGEGTVVALMDTGVDPMHNAFAGKWVGGTGGWYDPYGQHADPADNTDAHGTKVLGVVIGESPDYLMGMSPKSKWMAAKIFRDTGDALQSGIHASFGWMLDPDGDASTDDMPDVVNNSWGFSELTGNCDTEYAPDIALLKAADIMVVFAGGNSGPQTNTNVPPANNAGAMSVGGFGMDLGIDPSSSRGPNACDGSVFPILVAPGMQIRTSDKTFNGLFPNSFATVSGTSFASGHIAGAALLLRSAWPERSMQEIADALSDTATNLGPEGPDNDYGNGMPDLFRAYQALAPAGCTDGDNDGYFAGGSQCGLLDCNDASGTIHPGVVDVPNDGIDQDCNGFDIVDPPVAPPQGSSGGGGGGCFIENLYYPY